jgi:DnaJ-class molecular chaperone
MHTKEEFTMRKRKIPDPHVETRCAFCNGTGKDPFDLMSPLSTCQACSGEGRRVLTAPVRRCAYCKGTGVHPHSRMVCMTCRGAGQVTVPEKAVTCPGCGGSGCESDHDFHDSVLSCTVCGGKGVVDLATAAANKVLVMQP